MSFKLQILKLKWKSLSWIRSYYNNSIVDKKLVNIKGTVVNRTHFITPNEGIKYSKICHLAELCVNKFMFL